MVWRQPRIFERVCQIENNKMDIREMRKYTVCFRNDEPLDKAPTDIAVQIIAKMPKEIVRKPFL